MNAMPQTVRPRDGAACSRTPRPSSDGQSNVLYRDSFVLLLDRT